MHMGIDETGNDQPLRRVDHLRRACAAMWLDRDDLLVLDDDVGRPRAGWCDDAAAAHDLAALCTGRGHPATLSLGRRRALSLALETSPIQGGYGVSLRPQCDSRA